MPSMEFDDETYSLILAEAQRRGITPSEVIRLAMEKATGDSPPES